jgi:hypothetical protein
MKKNILILIALFASTVSFAAERKVADIGGGTPPAILANCHTAITSMGDKGVTLVIGRNGQDVMWASITNNNKGSKASSNYANITQTAKSGALVAGGPDPKAVFADEAGSFQVEELGESQGGTHVIITKATKGGVRVPQELICPSFNLN